MPWSNVAKPTGSTYTNVAKPTGGVTTRAGMRFYMMLLPLTISRPQNTDTWTRVTKPTGASWTNVSKPTD